MPDIDIFSLRFGRDAQDTPPLGPLYLAGALEKHGYDWRLTHCYDLEVSHPFAVEAFGAALQELDAPILALSVFNDAIPLIVAALDRFQHQLQGRRIIVGGPGVVGIAQQLLNRAATLDAVVVGEGETVLPLWMASPDRVRGVPGISLRGDARRPTVGRTPRENLNALPEVPWHWCSRRNYCSVPLSTMRGCPFDCSFCEIVPFIGKQVTARRLDLVLKDLRAGMCAIGSRCINILDDTFTISKKRVMAFCRACVEQNLDIAFSAFSRIDTLDQEMMEALAAAGCDRLFFGIDSGDDGVLRRISKGITVEDAQAVVAQASNYFHVTASMIWGYPFETWEAFQNTLAFASGLYESTGSYSVLPQLHLLSPSAGTPLFDEFANQTVLEPDVEGTLCGTMSGFSFTEDYHTVMQIMRTEPHLAAPFYRYVTPSFGAKMKAVNAFRHEIDAAIGHELIATLEMNHVG